MSLPAVARVRQGPERHGEAREHPPQVIGAAKSRANSFCRSRNYTVFMVSDHPLPLPWPLWWTTSGLWLDRRHTLGQIGQLDTNASAKRETLTSVGLRSPRSTPLT